MMMSSPRVWSTPPAAPHSVHPLSTPQAAVWQACSLPARKKQTKKPTGKALSLSSSVIWCHQVVSVISTLLNPGEETGEEEGRQHPWVLTATPFQGGLFSDPEGHYASEEFYLQGKGQCCLKENIKVGTVTNLWVFYPFYSLI